jgi:hypothetical protein
MMTGTTSLLRRRRPLLPLAPEAVRLLHRISLLWALAALLGLELAGRLGWLDHRPGAEASEIVVRPLFLVLFAVGAVLAWRWEIVGGLLATFTAAGILVWEGHLLEPWSATLVVIAFLVPGLAWLLLDLHDQRPAVALLGIAAALVAGALGLGIATRYYDDLFGPTHPDSVAEVPADTQVEWIWTGGVTAHTATVVAKPDDDVTAVLLRDATDGTIVGERTSEPDDAGIARSRFDGLSPDHRYEVLLVDAGGAETLEAGFRTFPGGPSDLVIALGSCIRVGTNGAVFDAIGALDPDLFVIDGDIHYANIDTPDADRFREVLDLQLSRPGPSNLLRHVPISYVWDDHDYGGNNADATSPTRSTALAVYREYVPSYVETGPDEPIYQAFDLGDVRILLTDVRSVRSPADRPDDADKTMLGAAQKEWLKEELLAARDRYALTIWVNPVPWIGDATAGADGWAGYATERAELADFVADHDIDRLLMLSGDAHMVAIDDGTNSGYATDGSPGFPVLHAGALDRPGHTKGGPYSVGAIPGGGQFGVVEIGHEPDGGIVVRLTGRNWQGETLLEHAVAIPGR